MSNEVMNNGTSAMQNEIPFEEVAPASAVQTIPTPTKRAKTIKKNKWQKLLAIQTVLKAPKNLYNSYGKYNYRNAEGILEAVKPYLAEQECILVLEDNIETRGTETITLVEDGITKSRTGERLYVKATAHFVDCETGEEITTTAYANECSHKGMSGDQCTGTASSYARKYCLNALFLLDDTKDSDTDEMKNIENAAQENAAQQRNQQSRPAAWKPTVKPQPAQNQGKVWGQPQGNVQPQAKTNAPVQSAQNNMNGWGKKKQ